MARVLARDDHRVQLYPPRLATSVNWRLALALLANTALWYGAVMLVLFAVDAKAKGWWF